MIILTVDPAADLKAVVGALEGQSVKVASVMENLHLVTVDADATRLSMLSALPGVLAAEEEGTVHLDPREVPDMGKDWPAADSPAATPPVSGSSWRSPEWDSA